MNGVTFRASMCGHEVLLGNAVIGHVTNPRMYGGAPAALILRNVNDFVTLSASDLLLIAKKVSDAQSTYDDAQNPKGVVST